MDLARSLDLMHDSIEAEFWPGAINYMDTFHDNLWSKSFKQLEDIIEEDDFQLTERVRKDIKRHTQLCVTYFKKYKKDEDIDDTEEYLKRKEYEEQLTFEMENK